MPLSEAHIQDALRLAAPRAGYMLFRNNVGVLKDERGVPVRYGLANESAAINQKWKSGDLIGWHSVVITPDMVGKTIAQFVSRECKPEGWRFSNSPREEGQAKWAGLVNAAGGDACFVCTVDGIDNPAHGY
jgi:hypothetical protein